MHIRDRIRELRRVRASELRPHPKNWRTHPDSQRDALRGLLAEIGYADALVARPLPDGSLELIDGHLRAETTPEQEVPVLVVDLDAAEAAKLLALHDRLGVLAGTDQTVLEALLPEVETDNDALQAVLDAMLQKSEESLESPPPKEIREVPIPSVYQVVVQCQSEVEQQEVYERLTAEGLRCRPINLFGGQEGGTRK